MRPQLQIALLNTPRSEAVETLIREDIEELDTSSEGILTRMTPRCPSGTSRKTGRGTASPSHGAVCARCRTRGNLCERPPSRDRGAQTGPVVDRAG